MAVADTPTPATLHSYTATQLQVATGGGGKLSSLQPADVRQGHTIQGTYRGHTVITGDIQGTRDVT